VFANELKSKWKTILRNLEVNQELVVLINRI